MSWLLFLDEAIAGDSRRCSLRAALRRGWPILPLDLITAVVYTYVQYNPLAVWQLGRCFTRRRMTPPAADGTRAKLGRSLALPGLGACPSPVCPRPMTNRSVKAISRQPSAILRPGSPDHQSNIINHRSPKSYRGRPLFLGTPWRTPLLSPLAWDVSGQFARAFCPPRVPVFPTNQRPSGVPQRTIRTPIVASNRVHVSRRLRKRRAGHDLRQGPKNTSGQIAEILKRQRDLSAVSNPAAGQFEERKPSAGQSGEWRAKGGEPIRGSHSAIAPFLP